MAMPLKRKGEGVVLQVPAPGHGPPAQVHPPCPAALGLQAAFVNVGGWRSIVGGETRTRES